MSVRETSAEAYYGVSAKSHSDAEMIGALVRQRCSVGMTRKEIANHFAMQTGSVSARVCELIEVGTLYELDDTRIPNNGPGRRGHVLVHSDYAPGKQMGLLQ